MKTVLLKGIGFREYRRHDHFRALIATACPSIQIRGHFAVSYPLLDSQGNGVAAITVPYAKRIDQSQRKTIPEIQGTLQSAAHELSARIGDGAINVGSR
jgi:DNA-binding IclR family transcriptional regulator